MKPVQLTPPPCRRNGKEGLSGMAIADITLLSGFHALRADLEKVQSATRLPSGCPETLHLCSTCNDQGPTVSLPRS